jgi:hypothetical protein
VMIRLVLQNCKAAIQLLNKKQAYHLVRKVISESEIFPCALNRLYLRNHKGLQSQILKFYARVHFFCNSSEKPTLEWFFPFSSNKINWSVGVILAKINSPSFFCWLSDKFYVLNVGYNIEFEFDKRQALRIIINQLQCFIIRFANGDQFDIHFGLF